MHLQASTRSKRKAERQRNTKTFRGVMFVLDMVGNLMFAAASSKGLVSITSVLASLYPIITVLLARILLAERVARSQEAGILLTLAGVGLISAG